MHINVTVAVKPYEKLSTFNLTVYHANYMYIISPGYQCVWRGVAFEMRATQFAFKHACITYCIVIHHFITTSQFDRKRWRP